MVQENYPDASYEFALKIRDLEESQKLSRERILLIGQNLIESQEKNIEQITQIKKNFQELNDEIKRIKSVLINLNEEVSKSARKEELAILERQYKLFQPLKYTRIEDVEKIIDNKLTNKSDKKEIEEDKHKFWSGKL